VPGTDIRAYRGVHSDNRQLLMRHRGAPTPGAFVLLCLKHRGLLRAIHNQISDLMEVRYQAEDTLEAKGLLRLTYDDLWNTVFIDSTPAGRYGTFSVMHDPAQEKRSQASLADRRPRALHVARNTEATVQTALQRQQPRRWGKSINWLLATMLAVAGIVFALWPRLQIDMSDAPFRHPLR
jgi:hypothetical protein